MDMTSTETANLAFVRDYLLALEQGATGPALARFFTNDAVQEEMPNRLTPRGGRSDLARLLARAEQGQQILTSQRYTVRSEMARGNAVAVEADWQATLAVPLESIPAGGQMCAHFAMFFEIVEGKIQRQRNYDCFEPW